MSERFVCKKRLWDIFCSMLNTSDVDSFWVAFRLFIFNSFKSFHRSCHILQFLQLKICCMCSGVGRNMIVMTVFLLIMKRAEFSLVHSREENCRYDRIHFDLKRIVIPNAFVPRTTLTCCNAMLGNLAFAVRDASVSRHNGGPIKDPPLNPSIR